MFAFYSNIAEGLVGAPETFSREFSTLPEHALSDGAKRRNPQFGLPAYLPVFGSQKHPRHITFFVTGTEVALPKDEKSSPLFADLVIQKLIFACVPTHS